jgi:very-short-patch-repair endonuclease
MEKRCEQCNKEFYSKRKKQKYCSVDCQYESYRKLKVERLECTCIKCGDKFYEKKSIIKNGRAKYCSRTCKDEHQKTIYLGEKNPMYGIKQDDERKKKTSIRFKTLWKTDEFRKKIKNGIDNFIRENGHYPGMDDVSKEKRVKTMVERYGIKHNWSGTYGQRKCDLTTLEIYGKTSADMLIDYIHYYNKKTDIEKIFEEFLFELKIPHQSKFRIYDKLKVDFWYKEYDFLILDTNILIEIDGDYWHGNEKIFETLSEFQKSVKINDKIKEEFANNNGYEVIRFWGSDVKKNKTETKNKIKEIWERLK